MPHSRVAAHLIVGARAEPFLEALLESLAGCIDTLIVNDNAPGDSPHESTFAQSALAAEERLVIDRAPFVDFAAARNRCLELHALHDAGTWVAFVDADEVHAAPVARIAEHLDRVPPEYDFVDGYTWHFFQSFEYYTSIERRMAFFRYAPGLQWVGSVHERLEGLRGKRLALPYVYGHYGHALSVRRHAEKGRHYSQLGAPGEILEETELAAVDPRVYFKTEYPRLLRFRGDHPPAVRSTIARLTADYRQEYELTSQIVAEVQTPTLRAINAFRRFNYEQRWRLRAVNPLARRLIAI
ncbi:MAG: hypothetical protein ABI182_08435 [Candidatus Baltobacteraceae bacterium]